MADAIGDLVDGVIQDPEGLAEAETLEVTPDPIPDPEAEEAEPSPEEEEPTPPDPTRDLVADYMKEALDGYPEEARPAIGKAAQTVFQKSQTRMGRALKQAMDEKEAMQAKLDALTKEHPTVPDSATGAPVQDAEMPDPTVDPLGYLDRATEKKLSPVMKKIEVLESELQQRRQSDQFNQEATALAGKYPALADTNSPEYQAFSAWLATHPDIAASYSQGSCLTLEHLYTLSNTEGAESRAEKKVLGNLKRQQRAATASTSPPQIQKERPMSLEEHLGKAWDVEEKKSPRS